MLGEGHLATIQNLSVYTESMQYRSKYETAEEMNQRALEGKVKVLGKDHADTLTSIYCLAYLMHQLKQYKDAKLPYSRAHAGYNKTLREDHPTTAACRRHYSLLLEEEKC